MLCAGLVLLLTLSNFHAYSLSGEESSEKSFEPWSEPKIVFSSDYDEVSPSFILLDSSLKLIWREYPTEKVFWATYNGHHWVEIESINITHSVRPCLIKYDGEICSVYYDRSEVFIQTVDGNTRSSSLSINGRTGWDFSVAVRGGELFCFYSVDEKGEFGTSQIFFTIYDGEKWTEPRQLTFPPKFAFNVHATNIGDDIFVVYASGPGNVKELNGWLPSTYFLYFDGEKWSQPKKICEGAPQSLTSYGNKLYLIHSREGGKITWEESLALRTYFHGKWSQEEILPVGEGIRTNGWYERADDFVISVYENTLFLVWTQYPVNQKIEKVGASNLWFITRSLSSPYELFIEIDYMRGHKPTPSVLRYIKDYFGRKDISITFFVDDEVPTDEEITYKEFFTYEAKYNDLGDDKKTTIYPQFTKEELTSKWKWVLYGTIDAEKGANGYCWGYEDAGNYIFIADKATDNWASSLLQKFLGVTPEEAETVVLMHELGHAIGILKQNEKGEQEYDENLWSVMAKLSHKNCNAKPIRYSPEYWKQRNMEYYKVELSEYVGGKYGARIIITGEDPRGF